jgi:formylglycine-generating enzyme required for sulfatase activity
MLALFHLRILIALGLVILIGDETLSHAQTIADLKAGVVKITAAVDNQVRIGTGFIVKIADDTAYILTASHVVEGATLSINFHPKPDAKYSGEVKEMDGGDPKGLAVVLVQASLPTGIHPLPLGSNLAVKGGEPITLIGFPRAIGLQWAIISGIISGQKGIDLVITGSGAQEGNSGGPILLNGSVVGILTEVQTGFGYAVPSSIINIALQGWGVHVEQGSSQVEEIVSPDSRKLDRTKERNAQRIEVLAAEKAIQLPLKEILGKDGAPMVMVPAGVFTMGSTEGEGLANEHSPHAVDLSAFYIDQYEVTVERYRRFLKKTRRGKPKYWEQVELRRDVEKPVMGVTWDDALTYCEWAGKRLPTEAEWEKAARGMDKRLYPWGASKPNFTTANFGKTDEPQQAYKETLKTVGSYKLGKSPYGAYDMAGNVSEWVADWYDEGPSSREWKVVRGGSWKDRPTALRSTYRLRFTRTTQDAYFGFRCAQDAS